MSEWSIIDLIRPLAHGVLKRVRNSFDVRAKGNSSARGLIKSMIDHSDTIAIAD